MIYKYYLYGMYVESEIEIEEAYSVEFENEPEVKITLGQMPEEVNKMYEGRGKDESFLATSVDELVFRIPNVAEYWVTKDKITVNKFEEAKLSDVKCFILGSCFGYCMLLRKKVVMHGGGISKNGKGLIITGESGAGKSTVTDALIGTGYQFIADDVCALSEIDERVHIDMAYPQQKLCRDAAVNKGYDLSELIYINEDRDKFAIRLKDGFLKDGADFDYLFEIVVSEENELSYKKVTGHEKLMLLLRNVYRGEDGFKTWGVPTDYMQKCLKIASTVNIYQIARPKDLNTLPQIVEFIDKIICEG